MKEIILLHDRRQRDGEGRSWQGAGKLKFSRINIMGEMGYYKMACVKYLKKKYRGPQDLFPNWLWYTLMYLYICD